MIDNPHAIIHQCVDVVLEFRTYAKKYGLSDYWQDVIERHFAEMPPDLLSGLQNYKPHVFSYILQPCGVHVEDAQWQEMTNGAFRLTAKLDGVEYRVTINHKSPRGKEIAALGGVKMSEEHQRQYIEGYFLPRHLERLG